MPVECHVQVGCVLAISMVCALALMRPAATADYFAPQFSQVGITPEIQDVGQYEVKVAILDGLADPRHRDLRRQVKGVFGFTNGTYTRYDNHGTFVAGIIGARENRRGIVGAAPYAKLYSYGVFDDYSFVHPQATSISLQDAAARGVTIANMSYGVPSAGPGLPTPLFAADDLIGINQVRDSILAVKVGVCSTYPLRLPRSARQVSRPPRGVTRSPLRACPAVPPLPRYRRATSESPASTSSTATSPTACPISSPRNGTC